MVIEIDSAAVFAFSQALIKLKSRHTTTPILRLPFMFGLPNYLICVFSCCSAMCKFEKETLLLCASGLIT